MTDAIVLILVAALVTFLLRAAPFAIFGGREMPKFIQRVADLMPAAIIAVLVVYCLKTDLVNMGMNTAASMVSVFVVVVLHLWKRNILLSIFGGTVMYMALLHLLPGLL